MSLFKKGRHQKNSNNGRTILGVVAGTFFGATTMLALSAVGALPEPGEVCVDVPEFEVQICGTVETTTTTTSTSTTSTTVAPTTTTVPPTTTTTVPPTTTIPPTTTTTTAPPSSIELTDDLVITDDETRSNFSIDANGHEIFIDGADVTWTDFTITDAARIMWSGNCGVADLANGTITGSGVDAATGFYPLHWHLCGDSTRGTTVDNVTIQDSGFRAFVPHGSHGISITNSACENIIGQCLWWDDPGTNESCRFQKQCTLDNTNDFYGDNIIADGISIPSGFSGRRLAAFQLGAGSGNTLVNSHAANVSGSTDCAGYHWPEAANQNVGGNVWLFEDNTSGNMSDPDCHGIFTWQNDGNTHEIVRFGGDGLKHGAYVTGGYHYIDLDVPYVVVNALGTSFTGGNLGDVTMSHHSLSGNPVTFTDLVMDSFTVNNDVAVSSPQPATYVLDGTNISCSDVVYQNVVPGTAVIIDGSEC